MEPELPPHQPHCHGLSSLLLGGDKEQDDLVYEVNEPQTKKQPIIPPTPENQPIKKYRITQPPFDKCYLRPLYAGMLSFGEKIGYYFEEWNPKTKTYEERVLLFKQQKKSQDVQEIQETEKE